MDKNRRREGEERKGVLMRVREIIIRIQRGSRIKGERRLSSRRERERVRE